MHCFYQEPFYSKKIKKKESNFAFRKTNSLKSRPVIPFRQPNWAVNYKSGHRQRHKEKQFFIHEQLSSNENVDNIIEIQSIALDI